MTNPENAIGTNGAFGGRTSPNALNDVLSGLQGNPNQLYKGSGVFSGWVVSATNAGQITLGGSGLVRDVAIASDPSGNLVTVDNISEQPISVDMPNKPTSGSRLDGVIAYVQNPPQGVSTVVDNPGACGIIGVAGSGPTTVADSTIRNAITADGGDGATAYYVVLATVLRDWTETTINQASVTAGKDLSTQAIRDNLLINRRPIWDNLVSTHVNVSGDNHTFTVKSQLGKTYTLYNANGGAGIHFPSQASLQNVNAIECFSWCQYSDTVNNQPLRVNGIVAGTAVFSDIIGTNAGTVSITGVGPRVASFVAENGATYATAVSMNGPTRGIVIHYVGQRQGTGVQWIYFTEAKLTGSQTNYSGALQFNAIDDQTIPGIYQMGTSGIVQSCRHIVRLFYQ